MRIINDQQHRIKPLILLLISFFTLTLPFSVLSQPKKNTMHIGEFYDNEGYIFFNIAFDSLPLSALTKGLMNSESTDTCYIKTFISLHKDLSITKDSINFECNNDSMLDTFVINNFLTNFSPSIIEPYNIPYEPISFYMNVSILTGPHDKSIRERFKLGYYKEW